ncbi:unnamed protein product [Didymodactylos carnosus]|uniref:Uncharacterized protein n=1 Tax=Didymodactylos carnosus TaxID=1234261 RepID=A0A8S2HS89_9BILA|nr:unnamed protein product [Didymodactylos carnosus]CAF3677346.1 unnamed protein product [Didymodactylos carnosus]
MGVDPSQVRSSINNIIVYLQRHAKSFNGMKKRLQNTKERLQKTETDIAMSKMLVMASDVADLYIRYCALRVLRSRGITAWAQFTNELRVSSPLFGHSVEML